ncbi:unnamed protein product [Parajaminaea phylloscopi]
MTEAETSTDTLTLNIKGPSEIKLAVAISTSATVRQLKEEIAKEKPEVPADSQRLIYAGKVLKDDQPLSDYKVQPGHTVHLVKSASRSAPVTGNPSTSASTTGSTAAGSSAAQGVPSNFGAGQQFTNNPLSALNRADLAGPHMARIGHNMFQGTGMNPADPNMMMNALDNPEFQAHMRESLRRPEVIDQMIAMHPEMAAMAPQLRSMMQSDDFINMMTNPASIRQMMQLQNAMGGRQGGQGGLAGLAGLGAGGGGAAPFPPPGAFGGAAGTTESNQTPSSGEAGQQTGAQQNPFAALGALGALGGQGGAAGAGGAGGMFDPQLLQQILGGGGAGGAAGNNGGGMGFNPFAALGGGQGAGASPAPADSRPPEERFATQLQSLRDMGFVDGPANLRALLISGGSVEGAIGILLGN